MILAEAIAEVARNAIEEGIAAGDEYETPAIQPGVEGGDGFLRIGTQANALAGEIGQQGQRMVRAEDDIGALEQVAGPGRQAGQTVDADANDVNASLCGGHGPSSRRGQRCGRSR